MGDPVWLADVLRAEGLECDVYPDAFARGHGDFGQIWGIVAHHTGASGSPGPRAIAEHPSLGLASQLHLDRRGKYTLCGVGIAWHAGAGAWPGIQTNNANAVTIGIEAENNGTEGWSPAQYDAYVRGVAAILRKLGHNSSHVIGHKEWAGPSQGKWDPGGIDMDTFRRDVQSHIDRQGSGGFMSALNDAEQRELLDKTRQLWDFLIQPTPSLVDGKPFSAASLIVTGDYHAANAHALAREIRDLIVKGDGK